MWRPASETDLLLRVRAPLDALLVSGARVFDLGQLLVEAHGHDHGPSHEAQVTQRGQELQERRARRVTLRSRGSRAPALRRVLGLRARQRLVAIIIGLRAVLVSILRGHRCSVRPAALRCSASGASSHSFTPQKN